ncbi:MAG: hypothetical protein ACN6NS_02805 [Acinetobacter johnsonii]|jgi:predicted nuclease with TOPRIM domain|uniref:hypothetical protein n=1 Tax=Acinetobacter sp. BWR-L5 TaxID=2815725 RepID=UPI0031FE49D0
MSGNRRIGANVNAIEQQQAYQSAKNSQNRKMTLEEIEAKLLAKWDKKVALQSRILELESEYQEAKEILDGWYNKSNPLYEKHKNCTESLATRIDKLKKQLSEMA